MKRKIIFYLLLIIPSISYSQNKTTFEGVINYDIKYISKDTSKVNEYCGNEAVVFIKQGNYKQEYPLAKELKSIIYRQYDNKYYYFFKNTDRIRAIDCSVSNDTLINIERSNTITEILKHKCKSIIFHFQTKTVTYFYTEDLYVDPTLFIKHKHFSYDRYAQETNSIYLKIIISDTKSDFIMTAKKIKEKKIDDNVFNITN